MSASSLPPIAAPVLVAAVDGLPARLRKKLDDAAAKLADRPVTVDGPRYCVAIDDATTVTLVTEGGVVRTADAVTCTCLLAPNCLHRAGVLTLAPVDAGIAGADADEAAVAPLPAGDGEASGSGSVDGAPGSGAPVAAVPAEDAALTTQQTAAVAHLWRAAVAVLAAGVTGSGAVARTALLRAAHDAQACKVYRPAAAARTVATLLQAARTGEAQYRLGDLTDAMRELLEVTHRLRVSPGAGLLGSARRTYELQGSLRLYGLCTTAVVAGTGYAGVVTYVADRDGGLWMIADLYPGTARRAATAGNATVKLGETALSHRGLTRAGLVVSGATASASRQLGAGKSVRAVTASGVSWHEAPLAGLWAQPAAEQVHRAFAALAQPVTDRPAGADLLFLSVRLDGPDADAVRATATDGTRLTLRVASDHPSLAYRDNLRLLAARPGLELLLVGRPDPGRPGTVYPLAIAPPAGTTWLLPAPHQGHADLAFDRLHRSHIPLATSGEGEDLHDGAADDGGTPAGPAATADAPEPLDPGTGARSPSAIDPAAEGGPAGAADAPAADGGLPGTAIDPAADGGPAGAADDPAADGGPAGAAVDVEAALAVLGEGDGGVWRPSVGDPALQVLRVQVERTVSGGRMVVGLSRGRGPTDADRLRRARLDTGAELLDGLALAAGNRTRDPFGRLSDDDGAAFAQAWLATAVYADAAERAYAEATWLPERPELEAAGH
ncbi:hypothetical protein KZZ52_13105 [Dactylosporangium sp. AC04546]|uniref:hypothetical protein n=1 Tax=Dactylosporangium sp. AC04546 TaxID=2862460 RepID=UPI0027148B29|nr:hypothetical protein [Dactylosporangium sp. AC04546]WVK86274.1 hypothetical protein KZZ52_13105 [Dactylosporangium sp. AC04546]